VDPSGPTVEAMTRLPLATLLVGAAGLLAACGGTNTATVSSSAPAKPAATATAAAGHVTTLELSADPHGALRFNTTALAAKAGTVKIVLKNPSSSGMPHGIAIQGHGSGAVVQPGGTSTVTAKLAPGKYTFLCPVPGHAAAGMTGTLTVR
jgi:plastocyanin